MCNKQAGPLCPFDALPLQTVKWTHVLKLQARGDDIFEVSSEQKKILNAHQGLTCMDM